MDQQGQNPGTQTAKQKAEELLQSIRKGKDVHDIFVDAFRRQYFIAGRTLEQWEKEFQISVPADPDPAVCKSLDMKLMSLHQEAAFYHAAASAARQILQKGNDSQYRARYAALVQEYKNSGKKLPARGTLEDLVRSETDDIEGARINAEIAEEFWEDIMEHLSMCRKLLENATINSGIQTKIELGHKGNIYDKG